MNVAEYAKTLSNTEKRYKQFTENVKETLRFMFPEADVVDILLATKQIVIYHSDDIRELLDCMKEGSANE